MIIGLSGYAQSGKDTVGSLLVDAFGFERVAFADKMKEIALTLDPFVSFVEMLPGDDARLLRLSDVLSAGHGWENAKKSPEVRRLLQRLGTEVGRNMIGTDFWVDLTFQSLLPNKDYVFTDVRFPNEAEAISAAGGWMVRVSRPSFGPANDHLSEVALDDWDYFDMTIDNSGSFEALHQEVSLLFATFDGSVR